MADSHSVATPAAQHAASRHPLKIATLKEGHLLKRQRGQSSSADLTKLRFQQRYISLTKDSLHYYADKLKKKEERGEFPIGDEAEIMYFKAKTDDERKKWIEAFRIAVLHSGNSMLPFYHLGAYGQIHQLKWSCCNAANRDTQGCQQTTYQYGKQHARAMSVVVESKSASRHKPRRFTSVDDHSESKTKQKDISSTSLELEQTAQDNPPFISQSLDTASSPLSEFEQERNPYDVLMHQDSQNDDESIELREFGDETSAATYKDDQKAGTTHRSPSIDSGFDTVSKYGGSSFSIVSDSRMSPSPSVHHRLNIKAKPPAKETILKHPQELPKLGPTDCPTVERKYTSSWKCKDLPALPSQSEVVSVLFRGVDTLIVTQKDGSVQVATIGKLEEGDSYVLKMISKDGATGSIDVWKNYLAIGSADLKVVNLDGGRILLRSDKAMPHPHLVAYTPRGKLLAYNRSKPDLIKVWPKVDTLWSSSKTKRERHVVVKDAVNVESLSVSPNPSRPWFAVTTKELLQVYDYETQELKSRLNLGGKQAVASFSQHGKYVAVACGKNLKLHDVQSNATVSQFPEFDVCIRSLAHNPWPENVHLAVSLSSGEVHVYSDLLSSTPKLLASLDNAENKTFLAYSKDGCTLAAVGNRGMTRLWQVPLPSRSGFQGVNLTRESELTVDSEGCQYVSPEDGYAISFPPGAIPEGKTATYKQGIVPDGPFGPFKFPEGVRPVSAIISLHPTTDQPLLKPVDIALPHIMHSEAWERLAVYKADCRGSEENGETIYAFEKMTDVNLALGMYRGDPNYSGGIPYAKFSTLHFCYLCIGEHGKERTDRAGFTLFEVKPKVVDPSEDLLIHFCLTYCLSTCHKTIREQYPEETHTLSSQSIVFSASGEEEQAMGIDFEERLGSWHFSLQGGKDKQITTQEVCFWYYPNPFYTKEMCDAKLYPPRFSVCARGRLNDEVRSEFKFTGVEAYPGRRQPSSMVYFPLPGQRHSQSLSTGPPLSRVNSDRSVTSQPVFRTVTHLASPLSQQTFQSVAQAFKACMCDLDDIHPSKLALTFVANDLIDDDTFESVQESMQGISKDEMVLRTKLLWKVYSALKVDAKLTTPLQEALKKLNPESAGKFASNISRLSRECSVASTTSLVTAPDSTPANELDTSNTDDGQFQEANSDPVANGPPLAPPESFPLTPHTPIQVGDNLVSMIAFNTQTSQMPADSCSTDLEATETVATESEDLSQASVSSAPPGS